ncbi:hypothetical protein K0M31_009250, partial [Melipona bicolor]
NLAELPVVPALIEREFSITDWLPAVKSASSPRQRVYIWSNVSLEEEHDDAVQPCRRSGSLMRDVAHVQHETRRSPQPRFTISPLSFQGDDVTGLSLSLQ